MRCVPIRRSEVSMEKKALPYPVCSREAFDLLNCAVGETFDQEKCLRLLGALRKCVVEKRVKKFVLEEDVPDDLPSAKSSTGFFGS